MNDLNNLMIWYALDDQGNPDRIVKLQAINPKLDLDAYFEKWAAPSEHRQAGVYTFTKEHIVVPPHIQQVEGVAFIMHYHGKRHRAILPYYVLIEED